MTEFGCDPAPCKMCQKPMEEHCFSDEPCKHIPECDHEYEEESFLDSIERLQELARELAKHGIRNPDGELSQAEWDALVVKAEEG